MGSLASGIIALASGLPMILAGQEFGWLGRGVRGPLRDAMLTDPIPENAGGRAFGGGFHGCGVNGGFGSHFGRR